MTLRNTLHAGMTSSKRGVTLHMTQGDFALLDVILRDIEQPDAASYEAMRQALSLHEAVQRAATLVLS